MLTAAGQAGGLAKAASASGSANPKKSRGGTSSGPGGLDAGGSIASGGNGFPEDEGNIGFDPDFIQQQNTQFSNMVMQE